MDGSVKHPLFSHDLDPGKASDYFLVLLSMGIDCHLERSGSCLMLYVEHAFHEESLRQIELFEAENSLVKPIKNPERQLNIIPFLSVFIILYIFQVIMFYTNNDYQWYTAGYADSAKILHGEWWRLVTALTLHADMYHILSNFMLLILISYGLFGRTGSGIGWLIVLLSGISGNLLDAVVNPYMHIAIGSSSAVFGSVGALGGLQTAGFYRSIWSKRLVPFAGALALLAFSGISSDPGIDVTAHIFGFISGFMIGVLWSLFLQLRKEPGRAGQLAAGIIAASVTLLSWFMAMSHQL